MTGEENDRRDRGPSPAHPTQHHDVTVIGGGWCGLLSCKCMLEEGLTVVALEKKEDVGGVWLYSDDPTVTTVMKSTHCTSSSTVTEISDFPMPPDIGSFPHHTDILEYLRSFAKQFNLMQYIKLNTEVAKVEKVGEMWHVSCTSGVVYTSQYLIVATGLQQKPNRELEGTTLKGYTGKVYHASEIKVPIEEHRGQRLLLLGGGETASDICTDWFDHVLQTYWSIPRGQHFFRKYAKVVPWGKAQALDKASSRMMKRIAPYIQGKPGLAWVCKWTTSGSLLAYQGHGIPEWKNDAEYFHFFINKNGKVLDLIDYEKIVPKGGILKCSGKEVTFVDGTKEEFDLVIMSTGYNTEYPYLPERYRQVGIRDRYKFVFDTEDPSLAFIGHVRPIVGSPVGLAEIQTRWVARVFSKKVPMKPVEERKKDIEADKARWSKYLKDTSQRIEGLVEAFTYGDDVAKLAQIYPDYWELFKRNPQHWYVAFFSPYNGSTFRLNEREHEDSAIETMKFHRQTTLGPLHLLLILFLRFIWFDWWLDRISSIKYKIQVSSWWPRVRTYRVVRLADYIWTLPKAYLFDATSDDKEEDIKTKKV